MQHEDESIPPVSPSTQHDGDPVLHLQTASLRIVFATKLLRSEGTYIPTVNVKLRSLLKSQVSECKVCQIGVAFDITFKSQDALNTATALRSEPWIYIGVRPKPRAPASLHQGH